MGLMALRPGDRMQLGSLKLHLSRKYPEHEKAMSHALRTKKTRTGVMNAWRKLGVIR